MKPGATPPQGGVSRDAVLRAITAVLAEPTRLASLLAKARDEEHAVQLLGAAFGLSNEQALVVLNQKFRLLLQDQSEALRRELGA